ncbi:MAG: hypothetical protein JSS24_09685 [Proteobacteria bacterium]|nr:hypothetical protein [Pseudomonadota bacterium]
MFIRHPPQWFQLRSEGARNWLALALLLAAWNFSDNDAAWAQTHAAPAGAACGRCQAHRRIAAVVQHLDLQH